MSQWHANIQMLRTNYAHRREGEGWRMVKIKKARDVAPPSHTEHLPHPPLPRTEPHPHEALAEHLVTPEINKKEKQRNNRSNKYLSNDYLDPSSNDVNHDGNGSLGYGRHGSHLSTLPHQYVLPPVHETSEQMKSHADTGQLQVELLNDKFSRKGLRL